MSKEIKKRMIACGSAAPSLAIDIISILLSRGDPKLQASELVPDKSADYHGVEFAYGNNTAAKHLQKLMQYSLRDATHACVAVLSSGPVKGVEQHQRRKLSSCRSSDDLRAGRHQSTRMTDCTDSYRRPKKQVEETLLSVPSPSQEPCRPRSGDRTRTRQQAVWPTPLEDT